MKAFIYRLLLFLLPVFIIAFFLEYTLQHIDNDYHYKNNYIFLI